jgi:EAL domain-containing protein (putative c-di-GMP-specific phosphodiesterase class I)
LSDAAEFAKSCAPSAEPSEVAASVKTVCAASEHGCLRCQVTPTGQCAEGASLLLGAQDADAAAALRGALDAREFSAVTMGPLLVLTNVRRRLAEIGAALGSQLSPYTQSCIRAAYSPTRIDTAEEALAALLFAEPLSQLLQRAEHEWVRDALAEDWLYSVFHPIIEAGTGRLYAQEALLRARHPDDGKQIGAGPIIQACEALNLQHQLDQRARRSAIRAAAAVVPDPTRIFINFLPNAIYDPEICLRTTMEAASQYGVPLSRLVFEVVETEKIPDMRRLHDILDYYRARGAGTAVDDMGAGFTSIEYLTSLRPDYVKLDRELVVEATQHRLARHKLDMIVNAARELGIHTIAEGIETYEQMQMCLQAGVELLQGFLFAKPANPPQSVSYPDDLRQAA